MRYSDLEIDLLRAFVAVAETGSFTGAAQIVGRSQSAVSQKIGRLEELVEARVFDRTSRSLSLTQHGEHLFAAARKMIEFNDSVMKQIRAPMGVLKLRLGISEDFIPGQLPALLARFNRLYPMVDLDLMTGLSCDILAAYDSGRLDTVIAKKSGSAPRGRVIWRDQLVWLASADYEVDMGRPINLVMLRPPCTYRELMISTLDAVRQEWVAACTASSLMGVQAAVGGGLGISILGRSFVKNDMRVLDMPEDWPDLPSTEVVIIGEKPEFADLVQALVMFLTENRPANVTPFPGTRAHAHVG
ncbi:MAG: LysR substrate-binding domain-containing protein [Pseudomonadota bacterium]